MVRGDTDTRQRDAVPTSDHEQPAVLVRAAYDLVAQGDMVALAPLLAVQAVAHEYDEPRYRATYHGRDAILARLENLAPIYWDAVHVQVHTIAVAGPLTAAIATWEGASRASGQTYAIRHVLVVRVAGRQFTDVWLVRADPVPALACSAALLAVAAETC